jgi:hypothetical protein
MKDEAPIAFLIYLLLDGLEASMTVLEVSNFGAEVHVEIILLAKKLKRCLIAFYSYLSK